MLGGPAELVAELRAAVRAEREALSALRAARLAHQGATARTTAAARQLRGAGVATSNVAVVVAQELGLSCSPGLRKSLAARLRQRLARERVTPGHMKDEGASPRSSGSHVPSKGKEAKMPRLIKRTITEEYLTDDAKSAGLKACAIEDKSCDDKDAVDGLDDDMLDELDEEPEDEAPAPRRAAAPRQPARRPR